MAAGEPTQAAYFWQRAYPLYVEIGLPSSAMGARSIVAASGPDASWMVARGRRAR